MKPNEQQILAVDECLNQIKYWKNTNDINSPTHGVDIQEGFDQLSLFDELNEEIADEISEKLHELLVVIRKLK